MGPPGEGIRNSEGAFCLVMGFFSGDLQPLGGRAEKLEVPPPASCPSASLLGQALGPPLASHLQAWCLAGAQ